MTEVALLMCGAGQVCNSFGKDYFTPYTKINSRWLKYWKSKDKNFRTFSEKWKDTTLSPRVVENFLRRKKPQTIKERFFLHYFKMKFFKRHH